MKRITLLCYKSSISFINSFVLSLSKPFDCIGTELTLGNPGGGGGGGGGAKWRDESFQERAKELSSRHFARPRLSAYASPRMNRTVTC